MSNEKSEISTFMGLFCPKSMIFKTDLWFEKWREGLVNSCQTTQKFENSHFHGLLLLKLYNA